MNYWHNQYISKKDLESKGLSMVCGSFDPIHEGHLTIFNNAMKDEITVFEITKQNADKGYISNEDLYARIQSFEDMKLPLIVTDKATFLDKSIMFPCTNFCVGYDTFERIMNKKYYNNDTLLQEIHIRTIVRNECSFTVYPRNGKSLKDFSIPNHLLGSILYPNKFEEVDISSSRLREEGE